MSAEFALQIDEVDVNSDTGRAIAREQRLAFTPGLIADGLLIAHGRLSTRALRRKFTTMVKTTQSTQPEGS
ncbi:hypothetical protein [Cryobacterium sp. 10I1]|uniref:hypothetical protein n=1 Tax=Cryobacterium sp. 10I1 TaxID=3048578 RepID=UPI002B2250DD|nr:hypothetical protein [Cryobacterium sp. 10I1]